jgi:hypothetical protein
VCVLCKTQNSKTAVSAVIWQLFWSEEEEEGKKRAHKKKKEKKKGGTKRRRRERLTELLRETRERERERERLYSSSPP